MNENDTVTYFKRWFVDPINKLKEVPNGDGGFIALMAALALYERLITAKLEVKNLPTNKDTIKSEMMNDLGLTDRQQSIFWDMFRNGLLHRAMPKKGKTGYYFQESFSDKPIFSTFDGHSELVCIDLWKFADRVLDEFLSNPELIPSDSFPYIIT